MDVNLLRELLMIAALAAFLAIVWWAYAPARKARFERDALLPFGDGESGDVYIDDDSEPPHPFPLSREERGNVQREMAAPAFPERRRN